ncbi:MAG: endonuclease [Candidatus Altiarchaeales archaeon ex4484_2]|nr:MAG: endonuclease [Candidatus Altiarchaeales archaeon ex4484_2]
MAFFVYMLRCSDGSLYTGYTSDLRRRLEEHKNGRGSRYVRSRLPVYLVHVEGFTRRKDAMKREREIKKLSRKQKKRLAGS